MARLRDVFEHLRRLPGNRPAPAALVALEAALDSCYRLVRQTEPTVQEVARQLDVLTDGITRLGLYAAELSTPVIEAVRRASDLAHYQLAQLALIGQAGPEVIAAGDRLSTHLAGETPWRNVDALEPDLGLVLDAYREARRALLTHQAAAADAARQAIKRRDGFATLTADHSHHVLRPIAEALPVTDEHAIAPTLEQLRDGFERALAHAVRDAGDRLDAVLSEGTAPLIRKLGHNLAGKEITTIVELDRALADRRERVVAELAAGAKVRLV